MKTGFKARQITLLGLLTAILLLMSVTPLGYLHIGPLAVTLNMIPVAVAASVLGPVGGLFTGTVFGLTSFAQCLGIGGSSPLGTALLGISPVRCFFVCVGSRVVTGFVTGLLARMLRPRLRCYAAVTGFLAASVNTVLFMGSMIWLYGGTEFLQNLIAGRNLLVFVAAFVGVQAVFELAASTLCTGLIVRGLTRARLLER